MSEMQGFSGFYLSHRVALVEYAAPILGSREAAEDVVQDAFMRFSPDRVQGSAPEQSLAYLYRIVRNLSFDLLRRRRVERSCTESEAPFWTAPVSSPTPEEALLHEDRLRMVNQVLSALPQETRVAVEMHRFGGFTLEEVAAHLGIPVATAHRHIRATMVKIALRLEEA